MSALAGEDYAPAAEARQMRVREQPPKRTALKKFQMGHLREEQWKPPIGRYCCPVPAAAAAAEVPTETTPHFEGPPAPVAAAGCTAAAEGPGRDSEAASSEMDRWLQQERRREMARMDPRRKDCRASSTERWRHPGRCHSSRAAETDAAAQIADSSSGAAAAAAAAAEAAAASTDSTAVAALLESSWQPLLVDLEEAPQRWSTRRSRRRDWTAVEWLGRTPWLDGWRFCNLVFTVLMKNNIMVFRLN